MSTKTKNDLKAESLRSEIIKRVKSIEQNKQAKKDIVASYNETIKTLEGEKSQLIVDLDELQRQDLDAEADKLIEEADE